MDRQHPARDNPEVAQGKPRVVEAFGDARAHRAGRPGKTMVNMSEVMDRSVVRRHPIRKKRVLSQACGLPEGPCHPAGVVYLYLRVARRDPRRVTTYCLHVLELDTQTRWNYVRRPKRQGKN
nr:hypothetical protein [Candidatus Sigynarchaeota archaeon]